VLSDVFSHVNSSTIFLGRPGPPYSSCQARPCLVLIIPRANTFEYGERNEASIQETMVSIAIYVVLLFSNHFFKYTSLTIFDFQCTTNAYILSQIRTRQIPKQIRVSSTFDQPKLKLFKTYQKEFAHRLFMLRESPRLDPVEAEADMSVPRILVSHTGAPRSAQSNKNYTEELSCKFTKTMMEKYDKLNMEFERRMKQKSWPKDLAELILLDIQFLK
jgi:hypothetical protein